MAEILNVPDPQDPTCLSVRSRKRVHTARRMRVRQAAPSVYRVIPLSSFQEADPFNPYEHVAPVRRKHHPGVQLPEIKRRIGVPLEYNIDELHPDVRLAWTRTLRLLQTRGHEIVPISLPSTKLALSAYYVLAPAEASSNLAKYDGVRYGDPAPATDEEDPTGPLFSALRGSKFGPEVKRRILLGTYSLSAGAMDNYFIQAQKVRRLVAQDFDRVFKLQNPLRDAPAPPPSVGVDFIVCPTAPTPPPRVKEIAEQSPLDIYVNDVFTVPASLAGLPAISVPAPTEALTHVPPEGMIGMQIIGQYGDDYAVIQFAKHEIEMTQDWNLLRRVKSARRLR